MRLLPLLLISGLAFAGTPDETPARPAAEGAAGPLKEGQPRVNGVRNTEGGAKAQRLAAIHRRCKAMEGRVDALEQELVAMDAELASLQAAVHEARGRKATDAAMSALLDALVAQRARSGQIYGEIAQLRVLHMREHIDAGDTSAKGCPVLSLAVRADDEKGEEAIEEEPVEPEAPPAP